MTRIQAQPELRFPRQLAVWYWGILCVLLAILCRFLIRQKLSLFAALLIFSAFFLIGLFRFFSQLKYEFTAHWEKIHDAWQRKNLTLAQERGEVATLLSSIHEGILAVDVEGNPLFYNARFAAFFYPRKMGPNPPRLGEIFRTPEVLDVFHRVMNTGEKLQVEMSLYGWNDPAHHDFLVSVSPLRHGTETPYGALGVFHEVSAMKRVERMKVDFVANVSHELKTPLTAIRGYAETLAQDFSEKPEASIDASSRQALDAILRNADRLSELVQDVLKLAQVEGDGAAMQKKPLSPLSVTQSVVDRLKPLLEKRGHRIQLHSDAESVTAERRALETVLSNLIENAIRYVPENGKIEVSWADEGSSVVLRVKDNGPGIAPEHLGRIFERFYRVEQASRSRELGGSGLGLAIVKQILMKHGGSVEVKSQLGSGSELICFFPKS